MLAIFQKELKNFFTTPSGYVFMSLFLLLSGIFFVTANLYSLNSNFNAGFIGSAMFIFMMVSPVLTMKIFADEKKHKTDQLLLTAPIKISAIVLGKYLAALAFFGMTLSVTILYALIVYFYGDLSIAETVGGYLGFVLLGSCFISIGVFISSTTENQIIAALVTFGALLLMWVLDMIINIMPTSYLAGVIFAFLLILAISGSLYLSLRNIPIGVVSLFIGALIVGLIFLFDPDFYTGFIARTMDWFSVLKRFPEFAKGYIRLDNLIYYLSFSGFFVFLTVRVIEKRRWS